MLNQLRPWSVPFRLVAALVLLLVTDALAAAHATAAPSCDPAVRFDPAAFSNPTRIDNAFLPLVPGTRLVLEGRSNVSGGPLPHRVVVTVTDLTKLIDGVRSVVVWDVDISDGQVVESELAFFAQDDAGNVWNTGEYPEEYEGGQFVGAPSTWISGQSGAKAGTHMLARPRVGTPPYLQGRVNSIGFLDCGQVYQTGQRVSVAFGSYDDVLVINEWSPLDPAGGIQRKFHAPGVGVVQIAAVDDPQGETLVLIDRVRLGRQALAAVREEALKLDGRAYAVSQEYRKTSPAE